MPQPQGAELEKVRARREELRDQYLRTDGDRPATTVQGVHHIALICKDVEETIKFYQEFLGFPLHVKRRCARRLRRQVQHGAQPVLDFAGDLQRMGHCCYV